MNPKAQTILDYWFADVAHNPAAIQTQNKLWWVKDPVIDQAIREQFSNDIDAAARGEFDDWLEGPQASVAWIVLLDQFSRNAYRDTPQAFAHDEKALKAAKLSVERGYDMPLSVFHRVFMYLPFEHSEVLDDQNKAVALYETLHEQAPEPLKIHAKSFWDYALAHHMIIERFGRFPHRNIILGRDSTPEEIAFLEKPGSAF